MNSTQQIDVATSMRLLTITVLSFWIPRGDLGVSEDEIANTRNCVLDIRISNEFVNLDIQGHLNISLNVLNTDIIQ